MSYLSLVNENDAICNNIICDVTENDALDSTISTNKNCLWPPNQNTPEHTSSNSKLFETTGIVDKYLESIVLQHNSLVLVKNHKMLLRHDHCEINDQVKILSGGPTGMEPLFSGFIGPGMLTGAIFGELNSSPTNSNILAALRILSVNNSAGIVVIVLNSFADRMNFGLACQQAAHEGIKVICLTVGEDCSGVLVNKQVGRRGSSGIVFLYKIAGAMAQDNKSLYEIHCVLGALKGKSLGSVNVGIQKNIMTIGSDSIKNEPGKKVLEITSIAQLVTETLNVIINPRSFFSIKLAKEDRIAIIINNLGTLNDLYLNLIVREVSSQFSNMGIHAERLYHGRFLTSGTEPSFSISILKVTDNILRWLDSTVQVRSWLFRNNELRALIPLKDRCFDFLDKVYSHRSHEPQNDQIPTLSKMKNLGPRFKDSEAYVAVEALYSIVKSISEMQEYLNKLDNDMDFGSNMKVYLDCVKNELDTKTMVIVSSFGLFNHLSRLAETVGGMVGPIFSVLFSSASQSFLSQSFQRSLTWELWMDAVQKSKNGLCAYSRALPGNGTVLDALQPFADTFNQPTLECLRRAVEAAQRGAEETASVCRGGLPDPAAVTIAAALNTTLSHVQAYFTEADASS